MRLVVSNVRLPSKPMGGRKRFHKNEGMDSKCQPGRVWETSVIELTTDMILWITNFLVRKSPFWELWTPYNLALSDND